VFDSSLPSVVCRKARVLFTLFVFLRIMVSNTYCVLVLVFLGGFVLFGLSSFVCCVPSVSSFSGLSILGCPL